MQQEYLYHLKKELNDSSSEKTFWVFGQDEGKEIKEYKPASRLRERWRK